MRRKRSLRQILMAVFLSAVLVAGMTLDATFSTAQVAENIGISDSTEATDSVDKNDTEVEIPKETSMSDTADAESNTSVAVEADNSGSSTSVTSEAAEAEGTENNTSVTTEAENMEVQEPVSDNDATEIQPEEAQPQEISMLQTQENQTELYAVSTLAETQTYTDGADTYEYTVNGNAVTITKYTGTGTSVIIPAEIDGKPVTTIGKGAFSNKDTLTSVTIPEGVTSIGEYAFRDSSLTSVKIPNSITSIGKYAFLDSKLESVTIPGSLTSIGEYAFDECPSLESVTIESGVTSISNFAFQKCESLITITIPSSVTSIGRMAFAKCYKLDKILITTPSNLTSIGDTAFKGCTSLTEITIPNGVKSIESNTFEGCTSLKTVTIPEGVTSIGNSAFKGCTSLTTVTIPSSVTSIIFSAFEGCTSLTTVTIPSKVTYIYKSTFKGCTSLKTVTIPESVTEIYPSAFEGCTSLTTITIPKSVKNIGDSAFRGDINITYSSCMHKWAKVNKNSNEFTNVTCESSVMKHHKGEEPTCTKKGKKGYYVCSVCDKCFEDEEGNNEIEDMSSIEIEPHKYDTSSWKSDGTNHWHECTICKAKKDVGACDYGLKWESDGTNHWHECTTCKKKKDEVACDYGSKWKSDGTNHWHECTVCKAKKDEATHDMKHVDEKAATCTEEGNILYYICQVCNKWFTDASGNSEITDKNSVVIQKKEHEYDTSKWESDGTSHWHECTCGAKTDEATHDYGSEWKSNGTNHWHECTCGAKTAETSHSFGDWTVKTPATDTEKGLQERRCTACGYKQTEEIPVKESETTDADKTDAGKIYTDKEQGENAPVTDFATPEKELIEAVLESGDQSFVENGTDIKIILDIDNIDTTVKQADKKAVTEKTAEYEAGQYLDISLYKLIGTDKKKISETNAKIKITIAVPDALKNTDSKKSRSYAVVRVHDGEAEILTDLDNDEATITIETNLFSTYAIVYKDSASADNNNNNSSAKVDAGKKDGAPKTGDEMPIEIYAMLAMIAGLTYLIMLFGGRRKGMKEK